MKIIHQGDRNRVIVLNDLGRIQSIKPLMTEDKYTRFYLLCEELKILSSKYPTERFIADLLHVPESDYQKIKDDIGYGEKMLDHIDKFYFNVSSNATVIAHKKF